MDEERRIGSTGSSRRRLKKGLLAVGMILLAMVAIWFGFRFALGTSSPFFVVSSESMKPVLEIGDIIVVKDSGTFNTLKVSDIIVFDRPVYHDRVIVHSVYSIIEKDGKRVLITKGINNRSPDSWQVTEDDYIGLVIFSIPRVGYVSAWLQPPVNFALIVLIIFIIFILEVYTPFEKKSETRGEGEATQEE